MNEQEEEPLYDLLPTVYRQRDIALGEPLRAFLKIIEGDYLLVRANIEALYDNWFIETCDEWVVPYLGDLLGVRGLTHERDFTSTRRSRVGNAIGYRRRKGVAAILERVAQNSTGWKAHVVEFFELLSTTQQLAHVRAGKGGTADLRDERRLDESGTPFRTLAHTAGVRNISGRPLKDAPDGVAPRDRYNIGNVGLYLWRLQSYPVTCGAPRQLPGPEEKRQTRRPLYYSFHPLGDDRQGEGTHTFPLFNQPLTETSINEPSGVRDVPEALRRGPLRAELENLRDGVSPATTYFGAEPVLRIFTGEEASPPVPLPEILPEEMTVCDLSEWRGLALFHMPSEILTGLDFEGDVPPELRYEFGSRGFTLSPRASLATETPGDVWRIHDVTEQCGKQRERSYLILKERDGLDVYNQSFKVAVDPVLGRLMFPPYAAPAEVRVSYSYGASAGIGGGPYERRHTLAVPDPHAWRARVLKNVTEATTGDGLHLFGSLQEALASWQASEQDGIIQVGDNAVYELGKDAEWDSESGVGQITLGAEQRLVIEAADGASPCVAGRLDVVSTGEGAHLGLNGLWVNGRVIIDGDLHLEVQHCTMKPGTGGAPSVSSTPSVDPLKRVSLPGLSVTISKSIVGRVCLPTDALNLTVRDSVVDGGTGDAVSGPDAREQSVGVAPARKAVGAYGPPSVFERSTIFGRVSVREISAASDMIFNGVVSVLNRESGSIRFSYVPHASQSPPLYRSQPWLALPGAGATPPEQSQELLLPRPVFTSETFGQPGYAQLGLLCPKEILSGAENGAEMGVFNFLHQPQRVAGLSLAIAEYLPYGHEVGVFYVN